MLTDGVVVDDSHRPLIRHPPDLKVRLRFTQHPDIAMSCVATKMVEAGAGRGQIADIVIIRVGRIVDGVDHQATALEQMVGEIAVNRVMKGFRWDQVDPVDHDDCTVLTVELCVRKFEHGESEIRAALKQRQQPGCAQDARIAVEAEPGVKPQVPENVAKTAADLDSALAIGLGLSIEIAHDVCRIRFTSVPHVPRVEAERALKQVALETPDDAGSLVYHAERRRI